MKAYVVPSMRWKNPRSREGWRARHREHGLPLLFERELQKIQSW